MKETNTYLKFKNSPQDNFPEYIVVHHSAASEDQTVESIENYHLSLRWEGVGYHYLITNIGEVWRGRPEQYHGAHVKEDGMNFKSIGICLIGDFDKKNPTQEQVDSLKILLQDIKTRYNIPLGKINPHRHFLGVPPYKSCYGKNLSDDWAQKLIAPPPLTKDDIKVELKRLIDLL